MIDFTDCPLNPYRIYGGISGKKIGITYQGKPYMLKLESENLFPSRAVSEYIGCHVMQSLGILAQETLLGVYRKDGKTYRVVACEDLEQDGYVLRPFSAIQNTCIEASSLDGARNRLLRLIMAIEEQSLIEPDKVKEFYWNQFIGDALIANPSRHSENWGFLINEQLKESKICPVYSCASSLYSGATEEEIKKMLSYEEELNYCTYVSAYSAMRGGEKKINYFYFLFGGFNFDCTDALLRIVPRIDMVQIDSVIDGIDMLSDSQKRFYKLILRNRKGKILDYAYRQNFKTRKENQKEDETAGEEEFDPFSNEESRARFGIEAGF